MTVWASAAGANVVTGLTATAAQWQSNTTDSRIQYGLTKYTFSGSPTLSAVLAGHRLVIASGQFTNPENTGNLYVVSADNTAKTITVRTTSRLDNSLDETGATAAASVVNSGSVIQTPSAAKQAQGYTAGEKPNAAQFNWLFNLASKIFGTKAGFSSVGSTVITSGSYINLDGTGLPYAASVATSDTTYTPSANDGTFETLTGSSVTLATQANRILSVLTATMDASTAISAPISLRYRENSNTVFTFGFMNTAGGSVMLDASFSLFGLSSVLSGGSNTVLFQSNRKTGRTYSDIRASAFELRPTDDSGNSLIYVSSFPATTQTIPNTNTYTDLTGYTTTQTFNSGVTLLIIAALNQETSGITDGGHRIRLDSTDLVTHTFTGSMRDNAAAELVNIVHLHDLAASGSQTVKLQGKINGSTSDINQDNTGGIFTVIELPDTYDGVALLRSIVPTASATTTSTSATAFATTGAVTTSGNYVLMTLSGKLSFNTNNQSIFFRFKIDGSNTDTEYEFKYAPSNTGDKIIAIALVTEATQTGSHTYSVDWRTSTGTATATNVQFGAVEICQKDLLADAAATITLDGTTGKKIELEYTGNLNNSSGAAVGLRFTKDGTAVGKALEFTAQSGVDTPFTLRTIADAPTAGSSPVYRVQAKTAGGTLTLDPADFSAIEIVGTDA